MISRDDFINFAKDTHLLDFECSAMGEAILLLSPRYATTFMDRHKTLLYRVSKKFGDKL